MIDPKYGSHLPVLTRLVDLTDGPVLELGMGLWSTPILDLMCRETGRRLFSYDNDLKWIEENKKWNSTFHRVDFVVDWESLPILQTHWSVVLIDHRPAWRRRMEAMKLANSADFILLHDSEPEIERFYRYSSIYPKFKYVYQYTKVRPHTAVLSNFRDPKPLLT